MKTKILLLISLVAVVLLASCAHVEPIKQCITDPVIHGFWFGLWNGMTAGFAFIGSLFDHSIAIYAVNNNGVWYNLGYVLGIGALGGGISFGTRSRD